MNEWYSEIVGDFVTNKGCFLRINLISRKTGEIKQANFSYDEIAQRADEWLNQDNQDSEDPKNPENPQDV